MTEESNKKGGKRRMGKTEDDDTEESIGIRKRIKKDDRKGKRKN